MTQESQQQQAPTPEPATPPSPEQAALDAFSKGVDEAAPVEEVVDQAETEPAEEVAEQTEAVKEGDKPAEPAPVTEPDPVADEIATLGLKEKAAERFKDLTGKVKELSTERESLAAQAKRADEWEQMVTSTGATPEQYSSALGYLQAINSGDPASMGKAFDAMLQEVQWLGQQLGREVPGLVDPLKDYADLSEAVENGDITRKHALEVAQARVTQQRAVQHSEVQAKQTVAKQAEAAAVASVNALDQRLRADPAYAAKMQALTASGTFAWIKENIPAEKWVPAIEREWQRTAVGAPAAKPAVGHVPLRPVRPSTGMAPQPKTDMEAFELGLRAVGGASA